jgi:hypothetical protein
VVIEGVHPMSEYMHCRTTIVKKEQVHMDHPLSQFIIDNSLLKIPEKSQGHLQNLSLVECLKIIDNGQKKVLEINPKLTKLFFP